VDGVDEAKKEAYKKRENDSGLTGRLSKAPTLADMTKGVIVRATSAQYAPAPQVMGRPRSGVRLPLPPKSKAPAPQPSAPTPRIQYKGDRLELPSKSKAALQQQQQPALQRTQTDELAPLPPTLQIRQSSLYRNLQGTGLLPAQSQLLNMRPNMQPKHILPKGDANVAMLGGNNSNIQMAQMNAAQNLANNNNNNSAQNSLQAARMLAAQQSQYAVRQQQQQQQGPSYTAAPHGPVVPVMVPYGTPAQWQLSQAAPKNEPALTRFTSQVSDWLNSFWPMESQAGGAVAPGYSGGQQQQRAGGPGVVPLTMQPSAEAIAAVAGYPTTSTTAKTTNDAANKDAVQQKTAGKAKPAAKQHEQKSKPSKRKSTTSTLPELPYGSGAVLAEECYEPPRLLGLEGMEPSELEQSVSATLLQLAASPTKLFTGLTSYFADDVSVDLEGTSSSNGGGGRKKRSKRSSSDDSDEQQQSDAKRYKKRDSLLDDYEETPMEARLRQVQYA